MMILETVLSDRYVCQISCFYPQVKYLCECFMLAATLYASSHAFKRNIINIMTLEIMSISKSLTQANK
jgi:hypothetical protein